MFVLILPSFSILPSVSVCLGNCDLFAFLKTHLRRYTKYLLILRPEYTVLYSIFHNIKF